MRAILPAAVAAAILGALTWPVACTPETYVAEDQFAGVYAAALCNSLQPCCAENGVSYNYTACEAGWKAAVENILYGPTSTGDYNPTLATQCIDLVRAANGAGCQPDPGTLSAARTTCQQVFAGNAPIGAPCNTAQDCAPMDGAVLACEVGAGEGGATGGELPLSASGITFQGLAFGLHPDGVTVCTIATTGSGGTIPTGDAGLPCAIHADAGSDTCPSGTYCDPKALTCMGTNMAGGGCDPSVIASCQPGNYCIAAGGGTGACESAGPIGSACTSSVMCDPAAGYCDVTTTHSCVAIAQAGKSCTTSSQCAIGVCDATTQQCLVNAIATTAACTGALTQ